jgi:hypothetical protein
MKKIHLIIFPIVLGLSIILDYNFYPPLPDNFVSFESPSFGEVFLLWVGRISAILSILAPAIYFGSKYSFVRTMFIISFIWLLAVIMIAIANYYDRERYVINYLILNLSPILLFWFYRFIRYGKSKIFKDK